MMMSHTGFWRKMGMYQAGILNRYTRPPTMAGDGQQKPLQRDGCHDMNPQKIGHSPQKRQATNNALPLTVPPCFIQARKTWPRQVCLFVKKKEKKKKKSQQNAKWREWKRGKEGLTKI